MLEQPPHVTAGLADGESPSPRVDAGIIGAPGESTCGLGQLVGHLFWVGVAIGADGMVGEGVVGRWVPRLVLCEGVLDTVGVQRGDVPAVGGVLGR
jgi:hypothetical protein